MQDVTIYNCFFLDFSVVFFLQFNFEKPFLLKQQLAIAAHLWLRKQKSKRLFVTKSITSTEYHTNNWLDVEKKLKKIATLYYRNQQELRTK
jgi:hypothetical protein